MKRKKESKLYISTEDIEELHEKYAPIFKQLNIDSNCGEPYINTMYDTTINALMREIEELSQARKLDIEVKKAEIEAKNDEQIPRYTHPLRRLFLKTPNRAMANILDNAELEANELHSRAEYENDVNAVLIERELAELSSSEELPKECKNLSRSKLKKLREKYEKLSALLVADKKLSKRKLKKLGARYDKLSALFAPASAPEEADKSEEQQTVTSGQNGSTPGANVQSEQAAQCSDETSEQLPKRKKRKPKPEEQSEQLPGQIPIEEVENADNGE